MDRKALFKIRQQERERKVRTFITPGVKPMAGAVLPKDFPKEFGAKKTGGTFSFYRKQAGKLGVIIHAGTARERDQDKIAAFHLATTEELLENANYDLNAAPVQITKAEFDRLAKFLPDPLPANIKII